MKVYVVYKANKDGYPDFEFASTNRDVAFDKMLENKSIIGVVDMDEKPEESDVLK